jgi:inosine/xanthosine triphosphate pyrophosphatase family protein
MPTLSNDEGPVPVLLATTNPAKERQMRWLLRGLPVVPVTLAEARIRVELEEQGHDHLSIAQEKAIAWSRAFDGMAMASDGGLLVPALGKGWSSLRTHRFAGPDDVARIEGLLAMMRPYRGERRKAMWTEALALAEKGKVVASWQVEGDMGIIRESYDRTRVAPGFWVASVCFFPGLGKSYGELSEVEREALGDAWSQLKLLVREFLRESAAGPSRQ